MTCSPNSSSGSPTTATSATSGCCSRTPFDLGRIDVHPGRNDRVPLSPFDEVAPLGIAPGEIADAEVAFAGALARGFRVLVVADDEKLVLDPELADAALMDLVAVVVRQPDVVARDGAPDGRRRGTKILGRRESDEPGLGGAGEVVEDVPEAIHDLDAQRAGERRSSGEDEAERARVRPREDGLREREEAVEHRRDDSSGGDRVALDELEERLGAKLVHEHTGRADEMCERQKSVPPVEWYIGQATRWTSSERIGVSPMKRSAAGSMSRGNFRTAPLGLPVVPDV